MRYENEYSPSGFGDYGFLIRGNFSPGLLRGRFKTNKALAAFLVSEGLSDAARYEKIVIPANGESKVIGVIEKVVDENPNDVIGVTTTVTGDKPSAAPYWIGINSSNFSEFVHGNPKFPKKYWQVGLLQYLRGNHPFIEEAIINIHPEGYNSDPNDFYVARLSSEGLLEVKIGTVVTRKLGEGEEVIDVRTRERTNLDHFGFFPMRHVFQLNGVPDTGGRMFDAIDNLAKFVREYDMLRYLEAVSRHGFSALEFIGKFDGFLGVFEVR